MNYELNRIGKRTRPRLSCICLCVCVCVRAIVWITSHKLPSPLTYTSKATIFGYHMNWQVLGRPASQPIPFNPIWNNFFSLISLSMICLWLYCVCVCLCTMGNISTPMTLERRQFTICIHSMCSYRLGLWWHTIIRLLHLHHIIQIENGVCM